MITVSMPATPLHHCVVHLETLGMAKNSLAEAPQLAYHRESVGNAIQIST
jgi:hypothetical protein